MAFGTWLDGTQLGATAVNTQIVQNLLVYKPSDESVTSSETIQNDDHLKFTVEPDTDYLVKAFIIVNGADGGGIEFGWYGPSGAVFDWCSNAFGDPADTGEPVSRRKQGMTNLPTCDLLGTGTDICIPAMGVLRVGENGGTFGFRWAQGNSNATRTLVKARSCLVVTKLV